MRTGSFSRPSRLLSSDAARLKAWPRLSPSVIAFAVFALVVALTGGSSRPDNVWLLVLRPITTLSLVAMLLANRIEWRDIRPLPLLLGLFAATIAIQLVPLPPSLWYGWSGRGSYDAVERALGGVDQWHSLAIAPDRAWNSLVSLLVPLTVLAGFAALDDRQRRLLLWPVLGLVAFTMILGLAQIATGGDSPFYWYDESGRGQLIGLLANRNHQGALLAIALPLLRVWGLFPAASKQESRIRSILCLCGAALIVLYILVLGSRAGVALTLCGITAAFVIDPKLSKRRLPSRRQWFVIAAVAAGMLGLLALVITANRAVSIGRILSTDSLEAEGRLIAMPTLLHITWKSLPMGTGFGSFVPVFTSYEPDSLLSPLYFNNAHNDLIELVITGGVPALLAFLVFFGWWARAIYKIFASPTVSQSWGALRRASAFGILIFFLASLTDYPLRSPLLAAVFTILCCWLACESAPEMSEAKSASPRC